MRGRCVSGGGLAWHRVAAVSSVAACSPASHAGRVPQVGCAWHIVAGEQRRAPPAQPPTLLLLLPNDSLQGNASTLTRSEVRGGGRKPYKQKGSGNARRGSRRSPLMPGGGISFGPKVCKGRRQGVPVQRHTTAMHASLGRCPLLEPGSFHLFNLPPLPSTLVASVPSTTSATHVPAPAPPRSPATGPSA